LIEGKLVSRTPRLGRGMTRNVKGFRTPAGTDAMKSSGAGVRKASREETAGGVCAGGGVSLWGFDARV
jgi:hypothetical protein